MLVTALWRCMWGRSPRGSNGVCSTLCWFSVTPSTTHNQIGPFWCCFLSGWVCVHSRTLWVSPTSSPVRLGVSPAATSTPHRCFQSVVWGFISPRWNSGLCGLLPGPPAAPCQPAAALPTPLHNLPPHWLRQPPPCRESSPPGCLSLPLLPVWMNVSSLSPWLSDFHTVQFSVSSGCFFFLNCCPSFDCVRRDTVSTYTSILAGSPPQHSFLNIKNSAKC